MVSAKVQRGGPQSAPAARPRSALGDRLMDRTSMDSPTADRDVGTLSAELGRVHVRVPHLRLQPPFARTSGERERTPGASPHLGPSFRTLSLLPKSPQVRSAPAGFASPRELSRSEPQHPATVLEAEDADLDTEPLDAPSPTVGGEDLDASARLSRRPSFSQGSATRLSGSFDVSFSSVGAVDFETANDREVERTVGLHHSRSMSSLRRSTSNQSALHLHVSRALPQDTRSAHLRCASARGEPLERLPLQRSQSVMDHAVMSPPRYECVVCACRVPA